MLSSEGSMGKKPSARPVPMTEVPVVSETTEIHTRILRLPLAAAESRIYWEHIDPAIVNSERVKLAFEQRWFGAKSAERVKYLLSSFAARYDAYPSALNVLRQWSSMDLSTCQAVCHWHLQLTDPIYRRFTGQYLVERRSRPDARVDRDAVFRWVKNEFPEKWSEATCVQFASKLLSAALEAGLVSKRDPRIIQFPKVTDCALAYWLYLLRETRFEGSLTNNAYLASVGLDEYQLSQRARALPGVTMRRMMSLVEFDWTYPDLLSWAKEVAS